MKYPLGYQIHYKLNYLSVSCKVVAFDKAIDLKNP